jgi:RNA polymerase sigma factor (sigma-70 family)
MKNDSTTLGGPARSFPSTRWSAVFDARDLNSPSRRQSMEELARIYWRPVYTHIRRKWGKSVEEAKDLTQSFFVQLTRPEFLDRIDPALGRFRSYVRAALDNFARRDHRDQESVPTFRLNFDDASEPSLDAPPDQIFLREWARSVMNQALTDLERECRAAGRVVDYLLFLRHDIHPPLDGKAGYEASAELFGIKVSDVNNSLYRARRRYRELMMTRIRETTSSEEEAEREFLELFRDDAP